MARDVDLPNSMFTSTVVASPLSAPVAADSASSSYKNALASCELWQWLRSMSSVSALAALAPLLAVES